MLSGRQPRRPARRSDGIAEEQLSRPRLAEACPNTTSNAWPATASAAPPKWKKSAATLRELGLDPLMADATVKRQREMGAIGKDDSVRASLDQGRAAMLEAISAAKKDNKDR